MRTWRRLFSSRHETSRVLALIAQGGKGFGASTKLRGAASLADVPYWRKTTFV
jgi:hypothetical protein